MKKVSLHIALLLLLSGQSWAMDSDRDQPIEVEADRMEMREQENISIYEGNVILVQGSLRINSDRMVIHFNEANDLTLLEMTGKPAKLRQINDLRQEVKGEAEQIDYSELESRLILRKSAYLDQEGDIIRGELIRMNTLTNNVEAGTTEPEDRVKMVIQPRLKPAPAEPAAVE
jgi:lipopolysaccharide export system protein LptA